MGTATAPYSGPRHCHTSSWRALLSTDLIGKYTDVARYVFACGDEGATSDEVEAALKMSHQSASAALNALAKDGYVVSARHKRKTRSGGDATPWIATKQPRVRQQPMMPNEKRLQRIYEYVSKSEPTTSKANCFKKALFLLDGEEPTYDALRDKIKKHEDAYHADQAWEKD